MRHMEKFLQFATKQSSVSSSSGCDHSQCSFHLPTDG